MKIYCTDFFFFFVRYVHAKPRAALHEPDSPEGRRQLGKKEGS